MKVYNGLDEFNGARFPVVTLGTFDGVHLGHQKLIQQMRLSAEEIGGETILLTFDPHPRIVLGKAKGLKLLSTLHERIALLEQYGIDHLIVIPFNQAFSQISSLEFVEDILVKKIGTKRLVIGYDHHFGRNREGSFEHLKEFGPKYGFDVEEISAQDIDDVKVSSTKIRSAIEDGNVSLAHNYLNHSFTLTGKVVDGDKIGRSIGFPTANLSLANEFKLLPKDGAYAVKVEWDDKEFGGMLNIGIRPTVNKGEQHTIEVNVFDFEGDLYGKELKISFIKRIRDEQAFKNIEELKQQLEKDKEQCLKELKQFV